MTYFQKRANNYSRGSQQNHKYRRNSNNNLNSAENNYKNSFEILDSDNDSDTEFGGKTDYNNLTILRDAQYMQTPWGELVNIV